MQSNESVIFHSTCSNMSEPTLRNKSQNLKPWRPPRLFAGSWLRGFLVLYL